MRIHILGICGTFMGGVALLAREAGIDVEGSDAGVYPPMSTQLEEQGIELTEGYSASSLEHSDADVIVVGNAMSRGNPAVEYTLNNNLRYISGPQWLEENVLQSRWVLAVSGTHGKTTTASMVAWILEYAGLNPGFLIGGVPGNFAVSARSGDSPFFVIEADEYDTAFFDKRSKFVHYRPRTLILNNLEYDHADIFPDLQAIKTQFHHLLRIVPSEGLVITHATDENLHDVLEQGCWSAVESVAVNDNVEQWRVENLLPDGSEFDVLFSDKLFGRVRWGQIGLHNVHNALSAIAAARHAGVPATVAIEALAEFKGVRRRMEVRGKASGVTVYDDFAHHPTAIKTTLEGLRKHVGGSARILALLELRSNTMRMGIHEAALPASLAAASDIFIYQAGDVEWDLQSVMEQHSPAPTKILSSIDELVQAVMSVAAEGDHILVMSNGGFGAIHEKLLAGLKEKQG
ncbi:MAG: UDP-N-acetylmuramate:L-alanyl-gamma-D-glutamyl-meso-diaminopimelate ligase [Gammaproteobacteria bacterium]